MCRLCGFMVRQNHRAAERTRGSCFHHRQARSGASCRNTAGLNASIEEALCRSSALYATLLDDPMYAFHREGRHLEASSWTILSPDVPVFRDDAGMELDQPWLLSFITCAAPYAPELGQPLSSQLLRERIHRVMAIAHLYDYRTLVLGAWGCGAFGNDTTRTAEDFREALERDFVGVFSDVVFAITDWSEERRFLGPFRSVFPAS